MTEKEPRKVPIGYEDRPDKPTRGAFRITALAIAAAAVVFLTLIAVVVMRSGGIQGLRAFRAVSGRGLLYVLPKRLNVSPTGEVASPRNPAATGREAVIRTVKDD